MASSFFNMDMYDDQSHKNLVFQILSSQSRLKAKSLHNLLKKKYLISYSYQATYKLLSELVEKNIVINRENQILLNKLVEISHGKWVLFSSIIAYIVFYQTA